MAIRMATAAAVKALKAQAEQADTIISKLKQQICVLQTATAASAGKQEEERLKVENDALRQEIEKVKLSLMVAEIRNGVRQVPVPQARKQVASVEVAAEKPAQTPAPVPKKEDKAAAAAEPKAKKAKKEGQVKEKPAKEENKGKGKKAAADSGAGAAEADGVDVSRLDFRIGKIVVVEKHPDADTLYVETVDLGEESPRTIVSGLVNHIPIEQMRERLAVFMCNLKASKMRGIASEGMIMCAKDSSKVEILEPPPGVVPGDRITFDGYPGTPDKQLNPKKKVWETLKPDIRTDGNRTATYKGVAFKVEGKGVVKAPTLTNAEIS
ncbi:aminoacyl tRNA synthase complex-interacting multifunctional protein 1-like [Babylonia areolata]|uniref:aminoacyl tRNA synthase complex-interacting multifunctional protein 1-like n=1 Tax=Babylonia areolata TaxID=304850 RepID=UPI003FCF9C54